MDITKEQVQKEIADYYKKVITQLPVYVNVISLEDKPDGGHKVHAGVFLRMGSGELNKIHLFIDRTEKGNLDWSTAKVQGEDIDAEKTFPETRTVSFVPKEDSTPPRTEKAPEPMPPDAAEPVNKAPRIKTSGAFYVHDKAETAAGSKNTKENNDNWPTAEELLEDSKNMERIPVGSSDSLEEDGFSSRELQEEYNSQRVAQESGFGADIGGISFEIERAINGGSISDKKSLTESRKAGRTVNKRLRIREAIGPDEESEGREDVSVSSEEVKGGDDTPSEDAAELEEYIQQAVEEFAEYGIDMAIEAVRIFCTIEGVKFTPEIEDKVRNAFEAVVSKVDEERDERDEKSAITPDSVISFQSLVGAAKPEIEPDRQDAITDKEEEEEEEEETEEEEKKGSSKKPEGKKESTMHKSIIVNFGDTVSTQSIIETVKQRIPEAECISVSTGPDIREVLVVYNGDWDEDATLQMVDSALREASYPATTMRGPELTEKDMAFKFGLAGGPQGIGMYKSGTKGMKEPDTSDPEYKEKNTSPGPDSLADVPEGEQGGSQDAGAKSTKGDKTKQKIVGPSTVDSGEVTSPGPDKLTKVKKPGKKETEVKEALVNFLYESIRPYLKERKEKEDEASTPSTEDVKVELDPVAVSIVNAVAAGDIEAAHEAIESYYKNQGLDYTDEAREKVEEIFASYEEEEEEEEEKEEEEEEKGEEEEKEEEEEEEEVSPGEKPSEGDLYAGEVPVNHEARGRYESIKEGTNAVLKTDLGGHPDSWKRVQMHAGTRIKTGKVKPDVVFDGKVKVVWDDGHEEFIEPSKLRPYSKPKRASGSKAMPASTDAEERPSEEWGGTKGLESLRRIKSPGRRFDAAISAILDGQEFPRDKLIEVLMEGVDEFKGNIDIPEPEDNIEIEENVDDVSDVEIITEDMGE